MCCLRTSTRCGWSSASATVTVDASIRSSACASRTGGTAATSKVREAKLDLFDSIYQVGGN